MVRILLSLLAVIGFVLPVQAQFASERDPAPAKSAPPETKPAQRPLPSNFHPAAPPENLRPQLPPLASPAQPSPPPAPAPTASPANSEPLHPWYVTPELGGWMIVVKSYTGPTAKEMAIRFAEDIRTTHKTGAYLFEWGSEERKRELARREEVKKKMFESQAPFLKVQEELRRKAQADGASFEVAPTRVRIPRMEFKEQWAVLIGGFKDMDAASKALGVVKRWPLPKDKTLLERTKIVEEADEETYLNPYAGSFVVPNPAIKKAAQNAPIDPALVRLNEEEPYNLLKCGKEWTLVVKCLSTPTIMQVQGEQANPLPKWNRNDASALLEATAKQARSFAQSLRHQDMKPQPLDAYVLHTRTGSVVTVGGFDGPDDPALVRTAELLKNMKFEVWDKPREQGGRLTEVRSMFEMITPMKVPR